MTPDDCVQLTLVHSSSVLQAPTSAFGIHRTVTLLQSVARPQTAEIYFVVVFGWSVKSFLFGSSTLSQRELCLTVLEIESESV